jgi:membrane-bound metal-dependent hydrolase YbcI (DUF457 family)
MCSSIGHAAMAILLRPALSPQEHNAVIIGVAATSAVAVDVDALPWLFGGGDVAFMGGHRAFTHSVTAAVVIAALGGVVLVGRQRAKSVRAVLPYLFLVIMSHGVLDMFTVYGDGVELFAPFTTARFKSPWKPFFDSWLTESLILWLPAVLFAFPRFRTPRLRATLALASVTIGLTVGLLKLSSPDQVRGYLSILDERMSSADRVSADSIARLIAATEASSSSTVAPDHRASRVLSNTRRCIAVRDTDAMAVSGEVTAGGWASYRRSWIDGGGGLWWRIARPGVGPSDTPFLSVRAIRLDRSLPPGAERNSNPGRMRWRQVLRSGDTLVFTLKKRRTESAFRSGVRVPTPGLWLFVATSGNDWGCFVFRV